MTQHTNLALRSAAIVLMLAGVAMIFLTEASSALAIAIVTLGIAIVAILEIGKVCNRPSDGDVRHGGHA